MLLAMEEKWVNVFNIYSLSSWLRGTVIDVFAMYSLESPSMYSMHIFYNPVLVFLISGVTTFVDLQ